MKPPKSLYNLQGQEHIKAFKREMFMYPVTREGMSPQKAETTLEQALIDLKEPMSNQKSRQEKFLKDQTILQGFDKDLLGDKIIEIAVFHKVFQIDVNYAINYYHNSGYDKIEFYDYSGAISDFNQTLKMDSARTCVYYHRGRAKFWIGDYGGTISDCSKAIEFDPNNAKNHVLRGDAKFKKGKKKEACRDWERARKLGDTAAYEVLNYYRKNRLFGGSKREIVITILKWTGFLLLPIIAFNPDTSYEIFIESHAEHVDAFLNNYWPFLLFSSFIFIIVHGMWLNSKQS